MDTAITAAEQHSGQAQKMDKSGPLDIRMSDSPMRSPRVTHEVGSPVRSVHPTLMNSIHSQADFGHRTIDNFDNSDEESGPRDVMEHPSPLPDNFEEHDERWPSRKRQSWNYLGGNTDEFRSHCNTAEKEFDLPNSPTDFERYLRLQQSSNPTEPGLCSHWTSDDSSSVRSVEELTPSRPTRRNESHGRPHHNSPPHAREEESPILPKQDKADHIIEAHQLTMQALLGNERALNTRTPPPVPDRVSRFPSSAEQRLRSASAPQKRVAVAPPPPIDTTAARSLPSTARAVKTPYPFNHIHRKEFGRQFSSSEPAPTSPCVADSVLTLSISRGNPHSRLRLSTLTVPANSEFAPRGEEKHFRSLDFDDAEFFRQLRSEYRSLLGPYRWLSARSLTGMSVSGTASRAADAGYGWLLSPRSPRALAFRGLSDTFSEEKMLKFFRRPADAGKSRYAWVSWAHRLAAAPAVSSPLPPAAAASAQLQQQQRSPGANRSSMIRRLEQHEGLEFVVSWSAKRILGVLALVLALSLTATLLWVLLGGSTHAAGDAGFRGAGDRVAGGVLVGVGVLLVGLAGMGGWIGVSWLVW